MKAAHAVLAVAYEYAGLVGVRADLHAVAAATAATAGAGAPGDGREFTCSERIAWRHDGSLPVRDHQLDQCDGSTGVEGRGTQMIVRVAQPVNLFAFHEDRAHLGLDIADSRER